MYAASVVLFGLSLVVAGYRVVWAIDVLLRFVKRTH
jgi:hypothetical protein